MKQLLKKCWSEYLRINWICLLIVQLTVIVEINSIQSVTINTTFSLMNVSSMNGYAYSSVSNDIFYCTYYDSGRNLHVLRKYNLTLLLQDLTIAPIFQITLTNQALPYNRLLEINGSHIICYSSNTNNLYHQVYDFSGSRMRYQSTSDHIYQFIFIKTTSQIYFLYNNGNIQIMGLTTFLGLATGTVQVKFQLNFGQIIQGFVSPNQMYMAIKLTGFQQVHILNLNTKSFTNQFYYVCLGSVAWNPLGDTFYVWDVCSGGIYQQKLISPFTQTFYVTYAPIDYNVFQFKYLNDTNQFLLIGSPISPLLNPKQLDIVIYNFVNLSTYYTTQYLGNIANVVSCQSFDKSKINLAIWFQSPYVLTYVGQIVVFVSNITVISNSTLTNTTSVNTTVINSTLLNTTFFNTTLLNTTFFNTTFLNNTMMTNITLNGTFSNTTLTNTTNSSSLNTTNSTTNITINPLIYSYEPSQLQQSFKNYLQVSLTKNNLLQALNKAPGGRKYLKPIFIFFANFDDLWLYIYHQKTYNSVVNQLFQSIQNLEQEKWETINYKNLWNNIFGVDLEHFQTYFNTQSRKIFTSDKFYQIQGNSNGYFLNTLNFYASNFILIILAYIIGRLILKILKKLNSNFKQCFVEYKFTLFVFLMIFEGNIQWMVYLFGFEMKILAYGSGLQKFQEICVLLLNFLFIFLVVSLYFLIKYQYKKESIRLYDNFQNVKNACFYLTLQWSIRNLVLGMTHIFVQNLRLRNVMLIFLQMVFLSINLIFVSQRSRKYSIRKSFQHKSTVWISILATLTRVTLIGTFLIDYQTGSQIQIVDLDVSCMILIVYILLWQVSILFEMGYFLSQLKQILNKRSIQRTKTPQSTIKRKTGLTKKTIVRSAINIQYSKPGSKKNQIHSFSIDQKMLSESNIKKSSNFQVIILDQNVKQKIQSVKKKAFLVKLNYKKKKQNKLNL